MNLSEAYLTAQVQSATPGGLIVMLYDGLLRFSQEAEEELARSEPNLQAAGRAVCRATAILTELAASLRPEYNPELSGRLSGLYAFFTTELSRALHARNHTLITGIIPLISELRNAWYEAESLAGQQTTLASTG